MLKQYAKQAAYAAGSRSLLVAWIINGLTINKRMWTSLPSRFSDRTRDYMSETGWIEKLPDCAWHNDPGLNFFTRVALEYRYPYLIELGALSLDRSNRLAANFPETDVYALDVTKDFEQARKVGNVNVAYNNDSTIREIAAKYDRPGLICSHGTLCCYPPADLERLFETAAAVKCDLAIAEPNTIGEESLDRSLRRTILSWYHPYLPMLRRLGFRTPDGRGAQIRDCWSTYGETRTYIFARAPTTL